MSTNTTPDTYTKIPLHAPGKILVDLNPCTVTRSSVLPGEIVHQGYALGDGRCSYIFRSDNDLGKSYRNKVDLFLKTRASSIGTQAAYTLLEEGDPVSLGLCDSFMRSVHSQALHGDPHKLETTVCNPFPGSGATAKHSAIYYCGDRELKVRSGADSPWVWVRPCVLSSEGSPRYGFALDPDQGATVSKAELEEIEKKFRTHLEAHLEAHPEELPIDPENPPWERPSAKSRASWLLGEPFQNGVLGPRKPELKWADLNYRLRTTIQEAATVLRKADPTNMEYSLSSRPIVWMVDGKTDWPKTAYHGYPFDTQADPSPQAGDSSGKSSGWWRLGR